jgi:Caspase domain
MLLTDFAVHLDRLIQPGTHALVIGVGRYPYLIGGDAPSPNADGMKQLTSPPISARAFADWLIGEYCDDDRPLASVALLLSEPNPQPFINRRTGLQYHVQDGTIANIATAVKQWKLRGNTSTDNRLIFYFCGHGISQGDDMALLASDFGADDDNPLNAALDFRKLTLGLKKCAACQQLFFIDACRANSDVLIGNTDGYAGVVPLKPDRRPDALPRRLFVPYYSTLAGDQSHARPGKVSLFTEALLKALGGAGSDNPEGDWRVTTSRLQEAIDHFMKEPSFAGAIAGVQVPVAGEMPVFEFHHLPGPPMVPVYVTCKSSQDNAVAEFVCRNRGQIQGRRPTAEVDVSDPTAEWAFELLFGDYEFEAMVTLHDVRCTQVNVRPTYRRVKLQAQS